MLHYEVGADIDLLYKLRKLGFAVIERPTIWESKEDSRIRLVTASVEMFLAVIRLRLVHSLMVSVQAMTTLPQQLKCTTVSGFNDDCISFFTRRAFWTNAYSFYT